MFVLDETTQKFWFNANSVQVCPLCLLVSLVIIGGMGWEMRRHVIISHVMLHPQQLPDALKEYEFIGTLLGLAMYNQVTLDLPLPSVVYKKILGKQTDSNDFLVSGLNALYLCL